MLLSEGLQLVQLVFGVLALVFGRHTGVNSDSYHSNPKSIMLMITDPVTEFNESIVPAYERYVKASENKELEKAELMHAAMQVASLLYHFREKLATALPHEKLTRTIINAFTDYDIIGDVCNVYKHGSLTQKPGRVYVSNPDKIEQTIVFDYFHEADTANPRRFFLGRTQQRVLIYTSQGEIRDLLDIATNVLNHWEQYLFDKCLTSTRQSFRYKGDDIIAEDAVRSLDKNSGNVSVRKDGVVNWIMIARYYEPATDSFRRWGWDMTKPGANLVKTEVAKDAFNAKIYGSYFEPGAD